MKQSMKKYIEERMNFQIFGALRRVKSPTKLEKMATPPLHVAMEKRSPSSVKCWLGLEEEEGVIDL